MLTIFSVPKPFRGHIGLIQQNALKSWTLLRPSPEILIFGDEEGIEEAAANSKAHHIADIARNEFGTPLLNNIFQIAQAKTTHPILCYINADIILLDDFMGAVDQLTQLKSRFMMVGQRMDLNVQEKIDFSDGWQMRLREKALKEGKYYGPMGIDYFIFSTGLAKDMPPFAVGRPMWDNWFLYSIRARHLPLIDSTDRILAIHQNHDYSHVPQKTGKAWEGPEAERNRKLAGGYDYAFTIEDATHKLTTNGIKRKLGWTRFRRQLSRAPVLHPEFHMLYRIWNSIAWRAKKIQR